MPINFPTSLDALTNPAGTDDVSVVLHSTQHSNANDAIEAIEAKVGIDGSAVVTSIDYKLTNAASSNPGHVHTAAALTGTKAQFDTACTDGNFLYVGDITQYTDELAQDAVGTILTDSSTIDFTYNDGAGTITAAAITNSSVQRIEVTKNSGAVVSTRKQLNFIEGSNVTLTIADDAGNDQVDITVAAAGGGGLSDADYGDITVSGGGTVMTIDNDVVTYAKMQNVSAADKLLGRSTAGAGDVEEIACTAAGRAILDDADAAAQRATLGAAASGANTDIASVYLNNTGLKVKDTNASHGLTIAPGSDLTSDRTLTVTTGDASRTLTISGDTTLGGGSHSGTNTGDQTSVTGNAGTVTVANEATDTTCFPLFATAASGSLEPKTNANTTYNSSTSAFVNNGQISSTVTDTSTGQADFNDVGSPWYAEMNWNPVADNSTDVRFAIVGYGRHGSATSMTGVAHYGGVLGYAAKNNATGTDAFVTGLEGRVGARLGAITTAAAVTATFDTNTENDGTMFIGIGFYVPDQTDSGHITVPLAFYNAWSAAPMRTLGQMQAASYADETGAFALDVADITGNAKFNWTEVTGTSQNAAVNKGYITNNAGLVTVTLPAVAAVGDYVKVTGKGAGGWRVAQNASQSIQFGTAVTTTGAGGRLDSTNRYDTVEIVCMTTNNDWKVVNAMGNVGVT